MSNQGQAFKAPFHTEDAVWLKWGAYEAAVLPEIGANLIMFRDAANNYTFLHSPSEEEMDSFKEKPVIHGIPVLFPPNRYEDGTFTWNGRTYQFPVNEEKTGNHLHGFFHTAAWKVDDFGVTQSESYAALSITVDPNHSIYTYLPHRFTIKLRYSLNNEGLLQHVSVHNEGDEAMPCMLAFHTSINAPFAPNSSADDYRFKATIGNRWELNNRMLPTSQTQPLLPEEEAMKTTGVSPFWGSMDNHYTAEPRNGRNVMELTDEKEKVTLVYDVGTGYKQWMIWNNNSTPGFFCPEPQLNLVNAPNVSLSDEEKGFIALEPGGIWEQSGRLYVRKA